MTAFRHELTPIHFLERAGTVYANRIAVEDHDVSYTWYEFRDRARRFASALNSAGIKKGDRVAFLALNSEPMLLAHFAVPMAGAILVAINTRLTPGDVGFILQKSGAKSVFCSSELKGLVGAAPNDTQVIVIEDEFETFLQGGSSDSIACPVDDENDIITINFTSGTTGTPKGVMYHHRGAYLNSLAMALDHRLLADSCFLWTLPMFHCNGWMFPWALAVVGAKSVCIPKVDPPLVWHLLSTDITHFCAAPTVLIMLANDANANKLETSVRVFTAGAPPSPTLIQQMTALNFQLDHVYGLTETYGPFSINIDQADQHRSETEAAAYRARQGFPNACAGDLRIVNNMLHDVPKDGRTMGEVVMRGNVVMKGYFDDEAATAEAFDGNWFHSGDLGVMHPDGSIELRDRKKDIIISGGENISTIEVEQAILKHQAVLECAVIAIPHDKWGEVPKAFVSIRPGCDTTEEQLIDHCRDHLAKFKIPKCFEVGELPKTSTGKIQKYVLRDREWKDRERRIN